MATSRVFFVGSKCVGDHNDNGRFDLRQNDRRGITYKIINARFFSSTAESLPGGSVGHFFWGARAPEVSVGERRITE